MNDGEPASIGYEYNERGQLAAIIYNSESSDAFQEEYTYTLTGQLKEQDSDVFNLQVRYEYPELDGTPDLYTGGITEVEWTNKLLSTDSNAYSFTYDPWGQLGGSTHFVNDVREDGFYEDGMTYDRNSNILSVQRYSNGSLTDDLDYRYSGNLLHKMGANGTPFEYDSNGNMTKDGRTSLNYHWNYLDLLGKVTDPDKVELAQYTWLADGSKCAVRDAAGNGFAYLGSLVYTLEQDAMRVESAGFAGGRMVASETQSGTEFTPVWFITDYLGSVRAVVSGDQIAYNNYYPYGGRWNDGAAEPTRWLYNGKEWQVTGDLSFLDFGSRMYDPALGRWVNTDPACQAANPYLFCANSPMIYVDPDGEFWQLFMGAAIGGFGYATSVAFSPGGFDNWNWDDFGRSVGFGALSGAISYDVGQAFGPIGSWGNEIARGVAHGVVQGSLTTLQGGNPWSGFASGALSSLAGSAFISSPISQTKGGVYAFSAIAGGIGAELGGGNFWQGAATGLINAGLNHLQNATKYALMTKQQKAQAIYEATKLANAENRMLNIYEDIDGFPHRRRGAGSAHEAIRDTYVMIEGEKVPIGLISVELADNIYINPQAWGEAHYTKYGGIDYRRFDFVPWEKGYGTNSVMWITTPVKYQKMFYPAFGL